MNTFGRIFRISIYGESHGSEIGVLIDGCPVGLEISESDFLNELTRRQGGKKGTTARKEEDKPIIKSGIFNGYTTGAPILIAFQNQNIRSKDYSDIKDKPRPGHADFTAYKKYQGFNDYRGGGHFSGRLTLALVAAGIIAKKLLNDIEIKAELIEAGGNKNIEQAIDKAIEEKKNIGGIVECRANNLPIGLGEPFFDSLESQISHLVFSIPAIKAIEFGAGFDFARKSADEMNDSILDKSGKTETNNSGGINGGISNGNEIIFRVAVKGASSISQQQETIDINSGQQSKLEVKGRHDPCIALRVPVVLESALAIVLLDNLLLKQSQS